MVVEDDPRDLALVREALLEATGPDTKIDAVSTLREAVVALRESRPTCALVDLALPDADNVEAVTELAELDSGVAIVALTGESDDELARGAEAVRAGAQDYLVKGEVTAKVLGRVVRYASERAAFREGLRRSQQVLASAMASSPIGMAFLALDGTYLDVNPAFARMLRLTRAQLVGTHFADRTHPEDRERQLRGHQEQIAGERSEFVGEKRYIRSDGCEIWALIHVTPVRGDQGELQYLLLQAQDVTAQRREDESRARLAAVVAESHDAIYAKDVNGKITSWNPSAERFFGYRAEEAVGQPASMLFPPGQEDEAERNLESVKQGWGVGPYETLRLRKDGSFVDVSVVVSPIVDENGAVIGASTIARDITQEKQVRAAIARSEARYRRLIESVHEGIWVFDGSGRTTLVNQRMADLLGYSLEALQPRSLWEFVDAEPQAVAAMSATPVVGGPHEVRLRRQNDELVWVLLSSAPLTDDEDGVTGSIISVSDITARKHQERELEDRERRFRAVFDHSQDAMLIVDDERRYSEANIAAAELLGRSTEELLTLRMDDIAAPEPGATPHEDFEAFKRVGHAAGDYLLVRPDGEARLIEFAATANVLPGRHLIVIRDVTDRKRAEEERAQLEAQLQQAQRIESIGMLAGGIAHDFNNLLSIILNYAEYARIQAQDTQLRDELEEITEAARRAAALTRQLLIFSRRDIANPEVIDVRDAVTQTVGLMRRTLGERITVRLDLPGEPMPIEIDRGQLDQVLLNLAVNARDAMPGGGELTFRAAARERNSILLYVSDTGEGMGEEVLSHAFEPFFSTKSRESGTGLGLSTTYGIVTQAGGTISLRSAPGAGTTAEIAWPRAEAPPTRDEQSGARGAQDLIPTALVVEDEASLRKLIARILSEHDYRVITAASGELALAQVATETIDLLITDVVMPGMQGSELAQVLQEQIPGLPVLYVSGYSEQSAELMEHSHLLEKPFTAAALIEAVTSVLEGTVVPAIP